MHRLSVYKFRRDHHDVFSERYVIRCAIEIAFSSVYLYVCYALDPLSWQRTLQKIYLHRLMRCGSGSTVKKKQRKIRNRLFQAGELLHKGVKNPDFRPIYRFISELIQYMAIVAMEDEELIKKIMQSIE